MKAKELELLVNTLTFYTRKQGKLKAFTFIQVGNCIECLSHARANNYTAVSRYLYNHSTLIRVIYFSLNPTVSTSYLIRHSCDNKACCNPEHLIHGTDKDNMKDLSRRGIKLQVVLKDIILSKEERKIKRQQAKVLALKNSKQTVFCKSIVINFNLKR